MLGAIIGDIVGSVYEFDNYCATDFEPFFHPNAAFTDDTVCTIAVADALLQGKAPEWLLKEWGRRYWGIGGWGNRFAQWLTSNDAAPYGSYGNGAAMRVSPAGLLAASIDSAVQLADRVTNVTHNHPEGIKGARATAAAIFFARAGLGADHIRREIEERFRYDLSLSVDQIRSHYRFDETCQGTVPQALICALEANGFEEAIRNAISIGGDSDTVAAIAGGLAEARFGIPEWIRHQALHFLPEEMQSVLAVLYKVSSVVKPGLDDKTWQRAWIEESH